LAATLFAGWPLNDIAGVEVDKKTEIHLFKKLSPFIEVPGILLVFSPLDFWES
jgi:hypothetical protein